MRAPVGRVAPALDQAALLQIVDEEDHAGRVEAHQLPDGLLGPSLVRGQPGQHAELARLEAQRGELLAEPPGHVKTQLDQEVRQVVTLGVARPGGARIRHGVENITLDNTFGP